MRFAAFLLLAALCWVCPAVAGLNFPPLTGRVVDQANILPPAVQNQLTQALVAHEQKTGEQVVVATLQSLDGTDIADYGYQLGRAWGIGQKGKNNGVLLIVAPNERAVRIEVGYGLEGKLTDANTSIIIQQIILPKFRAGDLPGGVVAGTTAILQVLGGDVSGLPQKEKFLSASAEWRMRVVAWLILLIIFVVIFRRNNNDDDFWMNGPGPGSGGGSGGGFSGGGGSFGGGGSSGKW